jgi:NitT/TauT family transport system ATP-binding protein/sulfonate transport system ATP-binding protein
MTDEKRAVVISCSHVSKTFYSLAGDHLVVDDLNFDVYSNEFVVLFGPGQCGKSTILNLIVGLDLPQKGEIRVGGEKVTGPSPRRGMVYQTTNLFMWYNVMKNVEFGPSVRGIPRSMRRVKAQHYIDLVGLTGFERHYPVKLSGGMQQRVGIARAYCNEPEVICMDEPFGHLDAQTRYLMEEEVERISNTEKRTVVFVTNNAEEAIYLADRIILLHSCPTSVHKEYTVNIERPRNYTSADFLALREQITGDMDKTI